MRTLASTAQKPNPRYHLVRNRPVKFAWGIHESNSTWRSDKKTGPPPPHNLCILLCRAVLTFDLLLFRPKLRLRPASPLLTATDTFDIKKRYSPRRSDLARRPNERPRGHEPREEEVDASARVKQGSEPSDLGSSERRCMHHHPSALHCLARAIFPTINQEIIGLWERWRLQQQRAE